MRLQGRADIDLIRYNGVVAVAGHQAYLAVAFNLPASKAAGFSVSIPSSRRGGNTGRAGLRFASICHNARLAWRSSNKIKIGNDSQTSMSIKSRHAKIRIPTGTTELSE